MCMKIKLDKKVKEICDSLINEPEEWKISTHTFNHHYKFEDFEFWVDNPSQIWDRHDTKTIFTPEQGEKIKKALNIAKEKVGNELQQKLVNEGKAETTRSEKQQEDNNALFTALLLVTIIGSIIVHFGSKIIN